MRRTTSLATAAVAGLAPAIVLLAGAPATGAGETCRGEAATIVGAPSKPIVGTEGRDVVVTNRSQDVTTLGGDDLICVTGPDQSRGSYRPVQLDAGAGDDVVDGTAAPSWPVDGTLGAGADRFEGGAGGDDVRSGTLSADFTSQVDAEHDVLLGGGGDDNLTSGQPGLASTDVVDGGPGDDGLAVLGTATDAGTVLGGEGSDRLGLRLAAGHNRVDNTLPGGTGEHRVDGAVVQRWTDLENFYLHDPASGTASVVVVGGPDDESFSWSGEGAAVVDLGAGDDSISMPRVPSADSVLAGGAGRDELATGDETHDIAWDLAGDRLWVGEAWSVPASGFEDAFVAAPAVSLWGTDGPNSLAVVTCDARLVGRNGGDSLFLGSDWVFEEYPACAGTTTMLGGRGHDAFRSRAGAEDRMVGGRGNDGFDARGGADVLFGGPGRDRATLGNGSDRFLGGPGRDRVDGERGRDTCRAEQERRCER